MSVLFRSFAVSRFAPAIAALWLCAAGPAWAGSGGGEDAPGVQQVLVAICPQIGTPLSSCPQLPTAAQLAANIAGLINQQIDDVRNTQTVFTSSTPCGRAFIDTGVLCTQVAINAANPLVISPDGTLSISELSPLAFALGARVTQSADPAARRFLYVTVIAGSDGQPEVLDIILDDTSDTNKQFSKGTVITFSLPLVILKLQNNSETPVTAKLTLTATCNGAANCLTGTVTGVPVTGKSPPSAGQLGIQFDSSFAASSNSSTAHRQWELQIPIVATPNNDGAYFSNSNSLSCPNGPNGNAANAFSGYCNAFSKPATGYQASVLGSGLSIGIAPYAAPLCPNNTCPTTPPKTNYFGFCASGANGPVAATFIHIGTDGTTIVTTPVSTTNLQCPS